MKYLMMIFLLTSFQSAFARVCSDAEGTIVSNGGEMGESWIIKGKKFSYRNTYPIQVGDGSEVRKDLKQYKMSVEKLEEMNVIEVRAESALYWDGIYTQKVRVTYIDQDQPVQIINQLICHSQSGT